MIKYFLLIEFNSLSSVTIDYKNDFCTGKINHAFLFSLRLLERNKSYDTIIQVYRINTKFDNKNITDIQLVLYLIFLKGTWNGLILRNWMLY